VTIDGLNGRNGRVIQGYSQSYRSRGCILPQAQSKVWSIGMGQKEEGELVRRLTVRGTVKGRDPLL